ncbi:IclR family transcriptional regulator [Kallipyga gabonensis]|uniref:IclR family transcriptional regulator n=1 Tax=Kallipyga gabonensis TaxID=1686287 RepID=UPI0006B57DA3|nr:IclR family transcriptional regulator [Kallipyga gabonensis]
MSTIQSLDRAIQILNHMILDNESTIADLSRDLDLAPSTVHRILQTLQAHSYVVKNEEAKTYSLGPALIRLGQKASANNSLLKLCNPVLRGLSEEVGEDTYFVIRSDYKGILLSRYESPTRLKIIEQFGYGLDLHCGAIRKVLLAFSGPDFWKEYLTYIDKVGTDYPLPSEDRLVQDLQDLVENKGGWSYGDYIPGCYGIGAPVFNADGSLAGSIGTIVPELHLASRELDQLVSLVKKYGVKFSRSLGYQ